MSTDNLGAHGVLAASGSPVPPGPGPARPIILITAVSAGVAAVPRSAAGFALAVVVIVPAIGPFALFAHVLRSLRALRLLSASARWRGFVDRDGRNCDVCNHQLTASAGERSQPGMPGSFAGWQLGDAVQVVSSAADPRRACRAANSHLRRTPIGILLLAACTIVVTLISMSRRASARACGAPPAGARRHDPRGPEPWPRIAQCRGIGVTRR